MIPWLRPVLLVVVIATYTGCSALFSKSEPLSVRYFALQERPAQGPQARANTKPLRLGRVTGASHLDVRMVLRQTDNELIYDESARWSENPSRYLERALARSLFEEQGIPEAMSGQALTLEAQLLAFEEVRLAGDHSSLARVSVAFTLHDERTSRLVETLTVERDLAAGGPEALVAAVSTALDDCVNKITARVVAELAR